MENAGDDFEEDDSTEESNELDTGWYEDDDDRAAFETSNIDRYQYEQEMLPLKHHSGDCDDLYLLKKVVTDVAWERIGLFLSGNMNLKEVRILYCNLTATGIASLFDRLTASALEYIDLNGNHFGNEGIRNLDPYLRGNLSLKYLDLEDSNLDPEAATLLSEALPIGSKLEHLDLSKNVIGNDGVKSLSFVLNICAPHLEYLDLRDNGIGKDGCNALAQLLCKSDSSLNFLGLGYNEIDDDCAHVLANALMNNGMLKTLKLSNSQITDTGWSYFLDLVSDTASFTSLCQSNHTLERFRDHPPNAVAHSVKGRLRHALGINRKGYNSEKAGREKIRNFVRGQLGEFNPKPLVGVDAKVIPHVFCWINRECDADNGWNAVYRILRDLPSLREYSVKSESSEAGIDGLVVNRESEGIR